MSVTFRPLSPPTDEEMLALHERNPGYRVERLADGALFVSPNGARESARNIELSGQLRDWRRAVRRGKVFDSSAGFVLPDTSLFSPDGSYVSAERWESLTPAESEKYFAGAPDGAFEIVSKTDSREQQLAKAAAFARQGSRLVVVIDPYRRAVDVWRDDFYTALGDVAEVDCDPVMPNFVLDVAAILEA
jgi:Uma2 family endonuclease